MQVHCPICQSELSPSEAEMEKRAIVCRKCGERLRLEIEVAPTKKRDLPQPAQVSVEQSGDTLRLRYKPARLEGALSLGFGTFWFIATWLGYLLLSFEGGELLITAGLISLVGVVYMVMGVNGLMHRVELTLIRGKKAGPSDPFRGVAPEASDSAIQIESGGLLRSRSSVLIASIRQVYCSRVVWRYKGSSRERFSVEALLRGGIAEVLVRDLESLKTAQYIEAKLEAFLEIEDTEVAAEAK